MCEVNPADRGHNQVTENKEHTRDPDKARHDQTKEGVKEKVPPAHAQAALIGQVALERNHEKRTPENEMRRADEEKKAEAFPDIEGTNDVRTR